MAKLYELDVRPHRSAFDSLLPEDILKVFACCDDELDEPIVMIFAEAM